MTIGGCGDSEGDGRRQRLTTFLGPRKVGGKAASCEGADGGAVATDPLTFSMSRTLSLLVGSVPTGARFFRFTGRSHLHADRLQL